MKNFPLWLFIMLLGISFPLGCVKRPLPPPWIPKIPTMEASVGPEEIFRLPDGEQISWVQLLDELDRTRVIFVGESHDQIEHHQVQVRVLQGLLQRGKDIVIAMEMFNQSQQSILDHWSQGVLTGEEFLKEIKWETTWGMDYQLYKPILDEAKKHHLKVLALNVQRDLVRKVAQNGIENLSPEDKAKLPEMDLTDKQHRAYIKSIYKSHQGGSAEDLKYFYQAQCLWDEGMAETLSEFLKSPEGTEKTIVVIAGSGHIVFNFGIPKRFYRRTPLPYQTVVLKTFKKNLDEDFTFNEASSPLANFLWITRPNPPEKKRPRIGVVLKEKEDLKGLWIERVIPDSPAEKAGLLSGDQLVAVEGKEIQEVRDIHKVLEQKGWGNDIIITINREGLMKEITVTLPPLKD